MFKNRLGCIVTSLWGVIVLFLMGWGVLALGGNLGNGPIALQALPTLVPTIDAASIALTLAPSATPIGQQLPPTWTPTPTPLPSATPPLSATPQVQPPTQTDVPSITPTAFITPRPFFEGPIVIGYSHTGRPIEVYRFGTGPVERMIVAGIHGGYEWNTVKLAGELINHISANPDVIPPTVTLYILPVLNPDGLARNYGLNGRVNESGVDLNRNFPINWAADWDREPCWHYRPTTSGSGPGSEPETQALMDFVENETRVTALISYHSAALGIFPGGEPPHEPSVRLAEALANVSTYPYPPVATGCFYTGTLADWGADAGIASVDLELHNHDDTDLTENIRILHALLAWRKSH